MGCGGSRLKNPDSIPARFRPILRRRIEEVRRRRRLVATKDGSAKEELLLTNGCPNDVDHRKSNVGKGDDSPAASCVTSSEEESKGKEGREAEVVGDGGNRKSDSGVTDLDGDTDDDDDDISESSIFYPASPSFRIYFVDRGDNKDTDDHSLETVKEEGIKEKIQSGDSDVLPEKEPGVKSAAKKARKKRSLNMAIPKGGQAAVKNLLNVKACYTTPCGITRQDRAQLLPEKPQP